MRLHRINFSHATSTRRPAGSHVYELPYLYVARIFICGKLLVVVVMVVVVAKWQDHQ